MNKKGFTLIELLVTITILGILTIMALPSVRRVQSSNRIKKYTSYEESLKKAAKAYVDSFEEDLFSKNSQTGCATIKYEDLADKKLVKDIKIQNITCAKEGDTFIQVNKNNNKYYYQVFLRCRNKSNQIQYKSLYYDNYNPSECITADGGDQEPPIIIIGNNSKNGRAMFNKTDLNNENTLKLKVTLKDQISGIKKSPKPEINLVWSFIGVDNEGNPVNISNVKQKVQFNLPAGIVRSITESSSSNLEIPSTFKNRNLNGTVKVYAEPVKLFDNNNNDAKEGENDGISNEISFTLDNYAPTINVSLWKWNGDTKPITNNTTGLEKYTENTWLSGKVLTKAEWKDAPPPGAGNGAFSVSEVDVDSITFTTTGATENLTNHKATFRNIEAEGKSMIKYHACDKVGNCTDTKNYIILLDRTAPSCTSSGGSATWVTSRKITGTCDDKNGNLDVSGCESPTITKTYTTDTNSTNESPGTVKDNAGNQTVCPGNQTVHVDVTPPTCSVGYSAPASYSGGWTNKNVVMFANCTDALSGCSPDNQTATTYSSEMNASNISPGVIRDNVGNTTTCPATGVIKIDKTSPKCTWDPKTTEDNNLGREVTVTVTCSDPKGSLTAGSGCKKATETTDLSYSTIRNDENTTAGTVTDNAGNSTACPKVRPYSDDDCKYYGSQNRNYNYDSLRDNNYFIVDTLHCRPSLIDLTCSALAPPLHLGLTHSSGYRKYRKEGSTYKVCLDESLDIYFDNSKPWGASTYTDRSYGNGSYPGLTAQTTGG